MNSIRSWRAGAVLLILGGVLETIAWVIAPIRGIGTDIVNEAEFVALRIAAVLSITGDVAIGIGLLLAGIGIRRRYPACWLLFVAGGAWLLRAIVRVVADVVVDAPSAVLVALPILIAVASVAAALGMVVRGGLAGAARWILLLPAIGAVLVAIETVVPDLRRGSRPLHDGTEWVFLVVDLLPILVGAVWLTVRDRRDEPAATRT
jgi:hypothetical protein